MAEEIRKLGIGIIKNAEWGTHLCQFYQTKEDLIEILVPYFKEGLKNNEFCMWVTSEPLKVEDAKAALRKAVRNLDDYIKKGQIEILDYSRWYTKTGKFEPDKVLEGWVKKEKDAIKKGFDGLRLTGNTFWLEKRDWKSFADYEATVNNILGKYNMLAICSYSIDKCSASEIIDVVNNHKSALIKSRGRWKIVESSECKRTEETVKESEFKYSSLFANMLNGFAYCKIIVDEKNNPVDWVYLEVNDAFERLTGLKRKDVIDKKITEAIPDTKKSHPELFDIYGKVALTGKNTKFDIHFEPLKMWLSISVYCPRKGYFVAVFDNITEQKKAEEELRLYEQITTNMSEGVYLVRADDGKIVYANPKFNELFGYAPGEMLGRHVSIVNAQTNKSPEETAREFIEIMNKKGMWQGEVKNIKKDGTPFWCYASISKFDHPEYGKVLVTVHTDITEKKNSEEMLRESEKILRSHEEELKKIVYEKGGRVKELTCLYDISKSIENQPDIELLFKEILDHICKAWQYHEIAVARVVYLGNEFRCCKFGRTKFRQSAKIVVNGKELGLVEVGYLKKMPTEDEGPFLKEERRLLNAIAERLGRVLEEKKAQQDLLESNRKQQEIAQRLKDSNTDLIETKDEITATKDFLQNVVDSVSEIIISVDLSSKITQWNRMAELITGYKLSEVIGRKFSRLDFVENRKDLVYYMKETLSNPSYGSFELILLTKDRRKKIILLLASILKNDINQPIGLAIIGKDITIKKQLHRQLSPGNSYLVEEQTSEKAYSLFMSKVESGSKGFCMTRTNPQVIKERYNPSISVLWLSDYKNENFVSASNLVSIGYKVGEFIRKNREGIILLDRLDYLISIYGFEEVLRFIYTLNEKVIMSNTVLLVYINSATISIQNLTMIEQEIQKLSEPEEKKIELTNELQEMFDFVNDQRDINRIVSFKDISRRFNITKSTARKRINTLEYTGLIEVKKKGRYKVLEPINNTNMNTI